MDGNGRWAKSRGEERTLDIRMPFQRKKRYFRFCDKAGRISYPFILFSTETGIVPNDEVNTLMSYTF